MAQQLRYEPDESPGIASSFALAFPHLILSFTPVLAVAIMVRVAGASDEYLVWGMFAGLVASGISIIVQSRGFGGFGAGYLMLAGTSGLYIAVGVAALSAGGPALLATLVVASSLFHFAISARLSLLQRVVTPAVRGTIRMLIVISVMPVVLQLMREVPAGTAPSALPVVVGTTLVAIVAFGFGAKVGSRWWLLAPVLGLAAGCVASMPYGLFDFDRVAAAPWIGPPLTGWPGLDLGFGADFWGLLPAFFIVAIINATRTVGFATAIQDVSWRQSRNPDRRAVQRAVAADGLGSIVCGLLGVVASNVHGHSTATVKATGVASRRVGICAGLVVCAGAFLPKLVAILLAVPSPVIAAGAIVMFAAFFLQGVELLLKDHLDARKAMAVGLAFWVGIGFQMEAVFFEDLPPFFAHMFESGLTAGGLTVIVLTLLTDRIGRHRGRMETKLDVDAVAKIQEFLEEFVGQQGWDAQMRDRIAQVAEETLLSLLPGEGLHGLEEEEAAEGAPARRLRLAAQLAGEGLELEFLAASDEGNIEDRMALLTASSKAPPEQEFSLRLLRHLATSVRHQQYHDLDIVTVRIDAPAA